MFQLIPRQVIARRLVPLTVRGSSVAPRLTPLYHQTSLRFYSDKKDPEKLGQEVIQDSADLTPNQDEQILSLRQKLYQTNTWHEAEQLRKQLRQHEEELPEPAINNADTDQPHPPQHAEEKPPTLEEPPLEEQPLQSALKSILQLRTLITDLSQQSHYTGESQATLANTELSKLESILEAILQRDLPPSQNETTTTTTTTTTAAADQTKILRWLEQLEKEKTDLVADLVNTKGNLKKVENRLGKLKKGNQSWAWWWLFVLAGGAGAWAWALPEEKRQEYLGVLEREWGFLGEWVRGRVDGMRKMGAGKEEVDGGKVVLQEKVRPEGKVVVYSSSKQALGRLDDQKQRLSRLSQFLLVLFWFLCVARGFPKVGVPGRVARY
ncbi:hypothetical protein QBC40DRAFT_263220 [Triangularia verruculosa]|uniref:Uncharacterized protein n=1 Tax=Triangularia verruculosa TaxID=2587418 RepID=A0AAN7AXI7_9PEZI|nr:hypothetical protein QBC40DRAFT_263220 [Triangularia verruculosa]